MGGRWLNACRSKRSRRSDRPFSHANVCLFDLVDGAPSGRRARVSGTLPDALEQKRFPAPRQGVEGSSVRALFRRVPRLALRRLIRPMPTTLRGESWVKPALQTGYRVTRVR